MRLSTDSPSTRGIGESAIVHALIPEVVPARCRALVNGLDSPATILVAGVGISFSGSLVRHAATLRQALPPGWQALEPRPPAFLALTRLLTYLHPSPESSVA